MSDDMQMLRDLGEVKAELSAVKAEVAGTKDCCTVSCTGWQGQQRKPFCKEIRSFRDRRGYREEAGGFRCRGCCTARLTGNALR